MSTSCATPKNFYRPLAKNGLPYFGIQLTLTKPDFMEGWELVKMPCGTCKECRKAQAREWAVRCCLEMQMHEQNTFITLTYDDENLPIDGGLDKAHLRNFFKRFRQSISPLKIRFLACGEYGTKLSRPHYHAIVFGYDFQDKIQHSINSNEDKLYTSQALQSLWPFGHCIIGDANAGTANYVAGYVAKKETGQKAESHYQSFNRETGEVTQIIPEFLTMSTTPGIGYPFYEKYKHDIFPADEICLRTNGQVIRCPVPYYFYRKLQQQDSELFEQVQLARLQKGRDYAQAQPLENTPERLLTKASIQRKAQLSKVRTMEGEQQEHSVDTSDIKYKQLLQTENTREENNQILFKKLFQTKGTISIIFEKDIQPHDIVVDIAEY